MKKKIYAALAFALYATTFHAQQIYQLLYVYRRKACDTCYGRVPLYPLSPCTVGTGDCKDESRWGECIANLYFLGIT